AVAGSAGTFVTLAAHVAAMAPGTTIGAAHPVGGGGEDIPGTLGKKLENSTAAVSESLARQRGRNAEWAGKAGRPSASSASAGAAPTPRGAGGARALGDRAARRKARPGEGAGAPPVLALSRPIGPDGPVRVVDYGMRLAERLLDTLAAPNVAYLLMTAG